MVASRHVPLSQLKDAVGAGRTAIDEKLKQKEEAQVVQQTTPAASATSTTKPAADASPAKPAPSDHPEIQPRVEGVGSKSLAGSCCTIS